jgi:hypothetical protein
MRYRYAAAPHPHLFIEEIVARSEYGDLRFPDHLIKAGDAWGITASDPQYAKVLENPHWRSLHDYLCGETFVREVLSHFADDMKRTGCLVDPERARLVPFVESREAKSLSSLPGDGDVNEVFTRLDFQSKGPGAYREFVHLDWPRRLVGGILFFSDAEEEGIEGGELAFYRDRAFGNDRWCHDPELIGQFTPKANIGIIFLNWNGAFHGPRAMTRQRGHRRWLYYTISSRADVWPHGERRNHASLAHLERPGHAV